MKLGEKWLDDHSEGKVVLRRTFDPTPYIERAAIGREARPVSSEMAYAGSIPGYLLDEWMKEAGLTMDQWDEVKDMLRKKLQSGDYNLLRGDERLYRKTSRAT